MTDTRQKICRKCHERKPITEFTLNRSTPDRKNRYCRSCNSTDNRRYYREVRRWRIYGITRADYDRLLVSQGQSCAICREGFESEPHIDHDHASGVVRGLLCCNCNQGVGHFRDDPARLAAAVDYLIGTP